VHYCFPATQHEAVDIALWQVLEIGDLEKKHVFIKDILIVHML